MIRPPAVKVTKVAGAFGCLFHLYFVIKIFVDSKKIMGGGSLKEDVEYFTHNLPWYVY